MDIDYEDDRRRQARRVVFVRLLGARLRRLREARGWTRLQMVSVGELDIGMQTLATYEYGSREMPVGRLFQLAETLLVRPQDLIAPVCDRVSGWRAGDGPRPADGVTIVLSSHLLSMMQSLCDRVALFRKGQIGLIGKVADLTADVLGGTHVVEVEAAGADLAALLGSAPHVSAVALLKPGRWRVDADADIRADIARRVVQAGGALSEMSIRQSSLDEVYVRFFEGENHDVAA